MEDVEESEKFEKYADTGTNNPQLILAPCKDCVY